MVDLVTECIRVIRTDPTLQGIVSGRIYRGQLPPAANIPAIVVTLISVPAPTNEVAETEYREARVQVTAIAKTDPERADLDELISLVLNRNTTRGWSNAIRLVSCLDAGGGVDTVQAPTGRDLPAVSHREFMICFVPGTTNQLTN